MKILFSGVPAYGHLLPLVPLATAAHAAGHSTALLTSGGMRDAVRQDLPNTPVLAAGPMPDAIFEEVARLFPGSDPARDPQPETVASFFAGARVDLTADEAIRQAQAWGPDLIVAEATDFVGPLVASALGIPYSVLAFGPAVPPEFIEPMFAVAGEAYRGRGLTQLPPDNHIDPTPPSLQQPGWAAPANHLLFRPMPHRRMTPSGYVTPPVTSGKKRVLVTLGTVFSSVEAVEAIIGSIDLDAFDVVATAGVTPGESRPSDRDGVHFVGFVPLAELLPGVDLIVNSGGAGTVLASFSEAIPMVVMPQGADQFINAASAGSSGAAIVVSTPGDVGPALATLAEDSSYRKAAERVAAEMASMPTAGSVIDALAVQLSSAELLS